VITNKEIASIFSQVADLLEIKGANPFKVRAYRNAARVVENSSKDFNKLVKEGFDLTKLPGIGKDLSEAIKEIVTTSKLKKLEELKKEVPQELTELLSIEGLGPKRVKLIYETFGVTNLEDLKKYAQNGELLKLPGFGEKLIEKILKGIKQLKKAGIRFLYSEVEERAEDLKRYLLEFKGVEIVEIAGSYRRKKESVGDLDILVVAEDYPKVSEYFIKYPLIKEVHSAGLTRSSVFLDNGLQVDLRAVSKESYGAALHYFTGSKAHNIEIRKIAQELGLKVNEYGVYKGIEKIASKTEEEVYQAVGLCYIEPELRENWGEIEACKNGSLPKLVKKEEIKGDFFNMPLKEAIEEAKRLEYGFLLLQNVEKSAILEGIKVIKTARVKILKDGSLEKIPNDADLVVAYLEDGYGLDFTAQTERIMRVLQNPRVKGISRLSLREVNKKTPLAMDYDEIFKEGAKRGIFFEVDCRPWVLDLNDVLIKKAVGYGVKIFLSTYASSKKERDYIKYGVNQARRGWCESKDVLNTSFGE